MNIEVNSVGRSAEGLARKRPRHERPLFHECVAAAQLDEEEQDVQRDQRKRHDRKGTLAAVVVTNR
jgi:hypothetical protein